MSRRLLAASILISGLMIFCAMAVAQGPPMPPMPPPGPGMDGPPMLPGEPGDFVPPPPPPAPPEVSPQPAPNPPAPTPTPTKPTTPGESTKPRSPKTTPAREAPRVIEPGERPYVAPMPGSDWTMFKGDSAHTGYTEEMLNFPLKLAWKHIASVPSLDIGQRNPSAPVVADGVVYFCSGRRLHAVDAETGALKWSYPAKEMLTAAIKSTPLVGEDLVYFGGTDGRLYAVTREDGILAWSFVTKGIITSSPILADGVVYVGSGDDNLYALDARTGQMKWPGGFRTRDDIGGSPAYSDGLVYFLSGDMVLYAAYATSGKIKWSARVAGASRQASPVISENTVYIASGNFIQAFQAKSGRLVWGLQLRNEITTTPAVANGVIYFGCRNGSFYALTTAGKIKWGEPIDLRAPIYGSPIIAGDTVFVAANKGMIAAIDVSTGAFRWYYTAMPATLDEGRLRYLNLSSPPIVSNGSLYVLADDGTLYAFRDDFPDNTPPVVSTFAPSRNALIPGSPPLQIAAVFGDEGSGIREDTVKLSLDGEPVEFSLIPERGIAWYRTEVTQPIVPLSNGLHTVALSGRDWAGNQMDTTWTFTVDNSIRRTTSTTGTSTTPSTRSGSSRPNP